MNRDQMLAVKNENNVQNQQNESQEKSRQSRSPGLQFTNDGIVVRHAISQSMNDGVTNRESIQESQIINNHQEDSFEENNEAMDMTQSQRPKLQSSEMKKKNFSMKKKGSLDMPIIINTIASHQFLEMRRNQSKESEVNIRLTSMQSPTKNIEIKNTLQNINEDHKEETSILQEKQDNNSQEQLIIKTKSNIKETKSENLQEEKQQNEKDNILFYEEKKEQQQQKSQKSEFKIQINDPIQIQLPKQRGQYSEEQLNKIMQVNTIIPCTLVSAPKPHVSKISEKKEKNSKKDHEQKKQEKQQKKGKDVQESIIIAHDLQKQVKEEQSQITKQLVEKIEILEHKIKYLQSEKQKQQKVIQESETIKESDVVNYYNSTPLKNRPKEGSPSYGSIRKNEIKNYATSQTHETSNMFRMRLMPKTSLPSNKLHSNIYNITLSEHNSNDDIREELQMLRNKISSIQNSQSFNSPGFESSKEKQKNFAPFQPNYDSPDRRQLKGRIVRKFGSRISKDNNSQSYKDITEQSAQIIPTPRGFKRNEMNKNQTNNNNSNNNNNNQLLLDPENFQNYRQRERTHTQEEERQRKRIDSSAIFKRNPKSSPFNSNDKKQIYEHQRKPNTLQFNMEKEKFVILDSRDTETLFLNNQKSQPISPIQKNQSKSFEIQIPDFHIIPTPQHHSEELIEIGKITFKKMGCDINDNTILNVKKYKNCVHFSISNQFNILWHYEGKFYFGGWKIHLNGEGQKSGEGIQYVPGKYRFKGIFIEGKRNGFGVLIMDNGTSYIGQWAQGLKHGEGKQIDDQGYVYVGEWKAGKRNGSGQIYFNEKLEFDGLFSKGLKQGYGKQYFENRDLYEGNYVDGKFHGKGFYKWHTGASYTGQFKNGQRNGHGIWHSSSLGGDAYEGEYQDDKKQGYGVYKWSNGSVYQGNFKNDLKHGEGTITYQNGKVAHLSWKNGEATKKIQLTNRAQSSTKPKRTSSVQSPQNQQVRRHNFGKSNDKLQSAKSTSNLSGQRTMPKGISMKSRYDANKFKEKASQGDKVLKIKLGPEFQRNKISENRKSGTHGSQGPPRDPPYRGMQTSTNIHMNI